MTSFAIKQVEEETMETVKKNNLLNFYFNNHNNNNDFKDYKSIMTISHIRNWFSVCLMYFIVPLKTVSSKEFASYLFVNKLDDKYCFA